MVRKLYANYFSWSSDIAFDIRAGSSETFKMLNFQTPTINASNVSRGSYMPTSGLFVGMIIHVGFNNNTIANTIFRVNAFEPLWGGAAKVLGEVIIPPGEIGCFYSDPDTSEFTREYLELSVISLSIQADDFSSAKKIADVTVMIGLETEVGKFSTP